MSQAIFQVDKALTVRIAVDFLRAMLVNPAIPANDLGLADLAVDHALALQHSLEAAFGASNEPIEPPKEVLH